MRAFFATTEKKANFSQTSAYFVFLYPSYAAFKSLSHRPVSEPELERWVKHFCVLGLVITYDFTFEWFFVW